ncbi:MAG: universal stress protein [Nitrospinota bacterium]
MKKFKRILAPTDFSPYSDDGLRYAAFLAEKFGAEVLVFHVISPEELREREFLPPVSGQADVLLQAPMPFDFSRESLPPPARRYVDEIYKDTEQEAVNHFRKAIGAGKNGFKFWAAAASGVPFVEIIRKAREENCDLIVMATHGRTGLNHVLMGSVSEKVVRMADCPVLTIRPADHKFEMP